MCTTVAHTNCNLWYTLLTNLPPAFTSSYPLKVLATNLVALFPSDNLWFLLTLSLSAILFCFSILFLWQKGLVKSANKPTPHTLGSNLCVSIFISPSYEFSISCNKYKLSAMWPDQKLHDVFVTGEQTFHTWLVTIQSVTNFLWHSCYRMAQNHSILMSQNLRHTWVLN